MEDKMYKESILVIGDLMIDKSWILSEIPCPTSQLHQSIIPQKRENPKAQAYKPGGAASTCLSLRILSETRNQKYSIIGMGIWNSHDDNIWHGMRVATSLNNVKKIKDNNERLFTILQLKTQNPGESVTTIKFRMYSRSISDIPELFARFDQDPDHTPHFSDEPFAGLALPKESVKAVVIMDFNKGTVTKELIQQAKKLNIISNDALWFIDSKAQDLPSLLSDLNFCYLVLNREEFGVLVAKMKGSDEPQYIPYGENRRNEILYSIKTALDNLKNIRWLVVKLDEEGAYLIDIERCKNNQEVENFYRCYRSRPYQAAGISAGDFFIASLVLDALNANKSISETPKSVIYLKKACSTASSWLKWSEEAYWKDVQQSKNSDVPTLFTPNELNNKIYDLYKNEHANWKCKSSNFKEEINAIEKKI
jgi:bifunctional ADP-heptose synthase (sugar kinase/adenylyltransferase)